MITYLTTGYFTLSFYVFGSLVMENDLNNATWYQLAADCFHSHHQSLESFLRFFMFTPMGLQLLVNGLFIWMHPANLPRWALIVTFLLNQLLLRHRTLLLPAELLSTGINSWLLHRAIHLPSVSSK